MPRTHTNLSYLINPLVRAGFEVTLFSEAISSDFEPIVGLNLVPICLQKIQHLEAALLQQDLVFVRHYSPTSQELQKRIRARGGLLIQYDQAPLASRKFPRIVDYAYAAYRLARNRPVLRVTPTPSRYFSASLRFSYFFSYPIEVPEIDFAQRTSGPVERVCLVAKWGQKRKNLHKVFQALISSGFRGEVNIISNDFKGSFKWLKKLRARRVEAYKRRLSDQVTILERRCKVRIFRNLTHSHALEIMSTSQLFILASSREPFAISPLEAAARGVPILISKGGSSGYFTDGVDSSHFSSSSSTAIRRRICKVLDNGTSLSREAQAAYLKLQLENKPECWLNFVGGLPRVL